MEKIRIAEHFNRVGTTEPHNGYSFSVGRALTIVILGTLCGLSTVSKIHQWAVSNQVRGLLAEHFGIAKIPCYPWLLHLLSIINPKSLNRYFIRWSRTLVPTEQENLTISFDGKTMRSTSDKDEGTQALHIVSAHLANLGITLGQKTVSDKSNEIPAMRELIQLLDINGCMVVADALNCQKETATAILEGGGDFLLNVKGNQEALEEDIKDYVQDSELKSEMDTAKSREKNGGRIEVRQAFSTTDTGWLNERHDWPDFASFGAINRITTDIKTGKVSNEWHYYISSRPLTAEQLLSHVRLEWSVESMHWLLDVHLDEDSSRVRDANVNQNLNITGKIALNIIRHYKNESGSKQAFSKLMFANLLDSNHLLRILHS